MAADGDARRSKRPKAPTHVHDARGRKVTQLDPIEMRLLRRHDVIDADLLDTIADEIGSGLDERSRRFLPVLAVGASILAIILVVQFVDYAFRGDPWGFFSARNIAFVNVWVIVMVFWVRAKEGRFGRVRTVMLHFRRCPHCGYDLQGLPPEATDGATLCPECGCAWKIDASGDDDRRAD